MRRKLGFFTEVYPLRKIAFMHPSLISDYQEEFRMPTSNVLIQYTVRRRAPCQATIEKLNVSGPKLSNSSHLFSTDHAKNLMDHYSFSIVFVRRFSSSVNLHYFLPYPQVYVKKLFRVRKV